MKKAYINPEACDRSVACPAARVCPVKAIYREQLYAPSIVNQDICIGCSKCLNYCPAGALSIITISEENIG